MSAASFSKENSVDYRKDQDATPWDMPKETFWDITQGSHIRRGQWVIDNHPEVPIDYLSWYMCLHDDDISQLQLPSENEARLINQIKGD